MRACRPRAVGAVLRMGQAVLLAVFVLLSALAAAALAERAAAAPLELEVRVAARNHIGGGYELGLQRRGAGGAWGSYEEHGTWLFGADAAHARWYKGTPIQLRIESGGSVSITEVRIAMRRDGGGRVEFGLQQLRNDGWWSALMLPPRRYFPSNTRHFRWLRTSPIALQFDPAAAAAESWWATTVDPAFKPIAVDSDATADGILYGTVYDGGQRDLTTIVAVISEKTGVEGHERARLALICSNREFIAQLYWLPPLGEVEFPEASVFWAVDGGALSSAKWHIHGGPEEPRGAVSSDAPRAFAGQLRGASDVRMHVEIRGERFTVFFEILGLFDSPLQQNIARCGHY